VATSVVGVEEDSARIAVCVSNESNAKATGVVVTPSCALNLCPRSAGLAQRALVFPELAVRGTTIFTMVQELAQKAVQRIRKIDVRWTPAPRFHLFR
jgi:hypothetical protein